MTCSAFHLYNYSWLHLALMIDIITILTLIINTNPQLIIRWQWRMCIQPVNLHRNKNLYIDGRSMRVVERWRKKFWSRGMDRGRWGLNKQMKAPRTRKWKYFRPFWGPFSGEASPRARGRRGSSSASFLGWEIHAESLARDGGDSSARGGVVHARKQLRGNLSAAVMGLAEMALVLDTARWSSSSSGSSASKSVQICKITNCVWVLFSNKKL
jgi:hypothetical protein